MTFPQGKVMLTAKKGAAKAALDLPTRLSFGTV